MREKNIVLKSMIFKRDLTQRFVAQKAELSEATLSMIIQGKYIPSFDDMERIAQVLKCDSSRLFNK